MNSFGASPPKPEQKASAFTKPLYQPKPVPVIHDNFLLPDVSAKKLTFDDIMTQETGYTTVQ